MKYNCKVAILYDDHSYDTVDVVVDQKNGLIFKDVIASQARAKAEKFAQNKPVYEAVVVSMNEDWQ